MVRNCAFVLDPAESLRQLPDPQNFAAPFPTTEFQDPTLESEYNMHLILFAVDGVWAAWGSWGTCTVTCGGGTQTRSRTCTNPAPQYNGADCPGSDGSSQDCNTHHCPSTSVFSVELLSFTKIYLQGEIQMLFRQLFVQFDRLIVRQIDSSSVLQTTRNDT